MNFFKDSSAATDQYNTDSIIKLQEKLHRLYKARDIQLKSAKLANVQRNFSTVDSVYNLFTK